MQRIHWQRLFWLWWHRSRWNVQSLQKRAAGGAESPRITLYIRGAVEILLETTYCINLITHILSLRAHRVSSSAPNARVAPRRCVSIGAEPAESKTFWWLPRILLPAPSWLAAQCQSTDIYWDDWQLHHMRECCRCSVESGADMLQSNQCRYCHKIQTMKCPTWRANGRQCMDRMVRANMGYKIHIPPIAMALS